MITSKMRHYAIIFQLAAHHGGASLVQATSFRGATEGVVSADIGDGDDRNFQPHHAHQHDRLLQDCAGQKRKNCPTGCDWIQGSCVLPTVVTPDPTTSPTVRPTVSPTNPPTPSPSTSPTNTPTTAEPSKSPTPSPTVTETSYCGCPQCTTAIWNTVACSGNECFTCGSRITYKQSLEGGSLTEAQACGYVSNEFSNGPCGPVCNPDVCNATPEPTKSPVSPEPTKSPTNVTPNPTSSPTTSPTQQYFCGCPACTTDVWNYNACNGSECYTCGSRISWLQSSDGGSKTEEEACTQVSNEFPTEECGPSCNPLLCNPEYLDEPDEANLIWNDEFDVDGSPNSTKWDYDLGDGCSAGICGWGNNEEQDYTSDPNNVEISNGILRISAKSNSPQHGYTSTRMVTRGKQAFKYGRIRFRASVANCQALGTWPALWMLPENWVYGGWPSSGEIDVMETVGHEVDKFFGTVHTEAYNHGIGTERGGGINEPKSDWHIFEIDWQMDNIRFAIDGQVYYQFTPSNVADYTQWPFDQDFHLLMNIAVGGSWGAAQGVDSNAFDGDGQYMEVDWVRVYSNGVFV